MRTPDIEAQLKQRPFVPFLLHMSDGSSYQIRHPEMLMVSNTVLAVGVYDEPDTPRPARIVMCDPIHITRLEPVNGHHKDTSQKT